MWMSPGRPQAKCSTRPTPSGSLAVKAQTDAIAIREVTRGPKWGRSCGEGSIESLEEADAVYDCGRQALDRAAWDEALQSFSRVASAKLGTRAAGALYWRAYSQHRLGQRAEALSTLGELKSGYPSSGWAAEGQRARSRDPSVERPASLARCGAGRGSRSCSRCRDSRNSDVEIGDAA